LKDGSLFQAILGLTGFIEHRQLLPLLVRLLTPQWVMAAALEDPYGMFAESRPEYISSWHISMSWSRHTHWRHMKRCPSWATVSAHPDRELAAQNSYASGQWVAVGTPRCDTGTQTHAAIWSGAEAIII